MTRGLRQHHRRTTWSYGPVSVKLLNAGVELLLGWLLGSVGLECTVVLEELTPVAECVDHEGPIFPYEKLGRNHCHNPFFS